MAKSKLVKANEKIAENVVNGYKKIEEGVVGGYKKIENGAVGGFNKIADKFVDNFLTQEGETVEEAKERLAAEQKTREEAGKAERSAYQNGIVEENMQKAQSAAAEARRKAGIE
ncbi:MAG: hypothetical protein ACI4EX_09225, partial [Lachnospiraceae bacterium]